MARPSKKPLNPKVQRKLEEALVKFFTQCRSKNKVESMLRELFGEEERDMIAKRLAAIIMLGKGHSSYEVRKTLNMGGSTENRIRMELDNGVIPTLEKMLCATRRSGGNVDSDSLIELLLYMGMPPFEGKGRRRWQQKMRGHRS